MPTLEALQGRIGSVRQLQSIVRTMKALAAVNVRLFERSVEALDDYRRTIEMGFTVLLRERPQPAAAEAEAGAEGGTGVVVFGSDYGLCGRFNDEIVSFFDVRMKARPERPRRVMAVGLRCAALLRASGYRPERTLEAPAGTNALAPLVRQCILSLEDWRAGGIGRVVLFHHRQIPGTRGRAYEPYETVLLPLESAWLAELARRPWPTKLLPAAAPPREALSAALVREWLFGAVYQAFAASAAAENEARLASLQAAEENIEDLLRDLTLSYHQERQTAITGELLDIVAGFEAVEGAGRMRKTEGGADGRQRTG